MHIASKAEAKIDSSVFWLMVLLTGILLAYLTVPVQINISYLPAIFFCVVLCASVAMLNKALVFIYNPLFWFLITASLYYGIGALFYSYGNEYSLWYLSYYNYVPPEDMAKVNTISCAAVLFLLAGFYVAGNLKLPYPPIGRQFHNINQNINMFALVCLTIGWGSRLLARVLIFIKGEEYIMPGIVYNLDVFCYVPIVAVGTKFFKRKSTKMRWVLFALVFSEIIYGITTKSKTGILMPIILVLSGYFIATKDIRRLIIGGVLLALSYVLIIQPFITISRITQGMGRTSGISISQAAGSFKEYLSDQESSIADVDFDKSVDQLSPLIRFSLWNAQGFALKEYDQGRAGRTVENIIYTPIPRVIWPGKPIMTMGHYWTPLVTGSDAGGGTGPGYIFELYWNGGYFLVFLGMFSLGILFRYTGMLNMHLMGSGQIFWAPIFVLSFMVSYNQEGWFAPSFGGFFVNVIFLFFFLILIDRSMLLIGKTFRAQSIA